MRYFELKVVPLPQDDWPERLMIDGKEVSEADYRRLTTLKYKAVLDNIAASAPTNPQGQSMGFSFDEMERVRRVVGEIRKYRDGQVCRLEDADFDYLKERVSTARLVVYDARYVDMKHDLFDAAMEKPESYQEPSDELLTTVRGKASAGARNGS